MTLNRLCFFVFVMSAFSAGAATVNENQDWNCLGRHVLALAGNAELISAVQRYNQNPPDPHALDKMWPALTVNDDAVLRITRHPAATIMDKLISKISLQGEGLLMGLNGGLVAATDKTTDFWQGDETQFTAAIDLPAGEVHVEGDTADLSSHSMLIKVSAPVFDSVQKKAIGVLVLGFDQFIVDFQAVCGRPETWVVPGQKPE